MLTSTLRSCLIIYVLPTCLLSTVVVPDYPFVYKPSFDGFPCSLKATIQRDDIYASLAKSDQVWKSHWIIYFVIVCQASSLCLILNIDDAHRIRERVSKMHATNQGNTSPWKYERVEWNGPDSTLAVTFTKIGHVDDDLTVEAFEQYIIDISMSIPDVDRGKESRFTCRVWFKEAIRRLNDAQLFVNCPDVDALEKELNRKATALQYAQLDITLPKLLVAKKAAPWSS
ncbi:uncharacterized protein EV420DRAFT_1634975 [Desarmillaria tabescens]|uniref:Uncharacterized protein n=1 Tax=Armillaria tabescens TaxID=1929756 RepID=A0AA39TVJ6_ARMTA|nr:uncharacterized protein EV420DRAFT_1634975 [Desarmillaria tabescens]KAK0467713.1 hypothetical protein EV420DRAFT_1634975 [Desarmillaria tabescens]